MGGVVSRFGFFELYCGKNGEGVGSWLGLGLEWEGGKWRGRSSSWMLDRGRAGWRFGFGKSMR